ncbi:hypothetical protein K458DRAFT_390469 [Lentithecium fluviatile CBS 122367]|uniref:Uncharacterized protein n=1 Tax=Lentithecium fluviatile CBS 122367 TaxID=1168545 RepID=A0A6G1IYJ5_9PLEO|nr:hypothetical protein K458DRAFT_390469 [Lentithecium fluviatile CBS 122367]
MKIPSAILALFATASLAVPNHHRRQGAPTPNVSIEIRNDVIEKVETLAVPADGVTVIDFGNTFARCKPASSLKAIVATKVDEDRFHYPCPLCRYHSGSATYDHRQDLFHPATVGVDIINGANGKTMIQFCVALGNGPLTNGAGADIATRAEPGKNFNPYVRCDIWGNLRGKTIVLLPDARVANLDNDHARIVPTNVSGFFIYCQTYP